MVRRVHVYGTVHVDKNKNKNTDVYMMYNGTAAKCKKYICVVYQPVIPVRTRVVQKHAQKHVQKVRVCWYRVHVHGTCTR